MSLIVYVKIKATGLKIQHCQFLLRSEQGVCFHLQMKEMFQQLGFDDLPAPNDLSSLIPFLSKVPMGVSSSVSAATFFQNRSGEVCEILKKFDHKYN